MANMEYEIFVCDCENIAKELHTIVEAKKYERYGWASIVFMTDKFGGTYLCLHYNLNTNKITYKYGFDSAEEIKDLERLKELVKTERDKMLKERDLDYISEMINGEY